ncbi:kunitz-type trypsin inhibitor KTI1-like [Prosopis cineraria]|uniref:kunitz-type trypsin inhibitor KTI1-like n=1 Tax=Prosopis cineraria TaxID=364024 RepID=UPI0024109978|nr:kunitz-type trypsin inhibitor KTI1-like [Prosopis cineraria]XP_054781863.1 kunitz-type trypsin inhibitor KTI1-like [Prosopis cineraria]
MKTTMFSLFVLFAFTSSAPAQIVQDSDGDDVRNGGQYYLLPNSYGYGGGINTFPSYSQICDYTLGQSSSSSDEGYAVTVATPYNIGVIPSSLNVSFYFDGTIPGCSTSPTNWKIYSSGNGTDDTYTVTTSENSNTVSGSFKIVNSGISTLMYKLHFCADKANSCLHVGISEDDTGNRLWTLTHGKPFLFVFRKVGAAAA